MVSVVEVQNFLEEIRAVCIKHRLSIGHEDIHGSFIVTDYNEECAEWLESADYQEEINF